MFSVVNKKLIMCSTLALILSACGSSGSPGEVDGFNQVDDAGSNGNANDNTNGNSNASGNVPAELRGTWVVACEANTTDGSSDYLQVDFGASGFDSVVRIWDNNTTCSGTPDYEATSTGTLTTGNAFRTNSGVDATAIDLTATQTVRDGNMVENFPANTVYDIYFISDSNPAQLYFGDEDTGEGDTPQDRPTDIDFTFFYTRQ